MPAELPFGHPNYLWPCQGLRPVDGTWLHVYAADLARAPDGRWWLLADRTQAPSGAGYALENREILEQVHPEADPRHGGAARARVLRRRCAPTLLDAAGDEAPLAVILTPGPYNETYFEHAYLARQLGMPLVEGSDLTVRGDTVFLKTLGGLRRVHSILRRLDDDFCDPLELRSDSALGVPGLLGALRAGRVMVANALGTGVLESAAWLGFLPPIAERLIGEKLLLPEVATWWLGEKPALEYVLANLDRLVIKPAYPNQRFEPMFGRDFEGEERDAAHRAPAQPSVRLRGAGARAPVAGAGVEIRGVVRARGARADHPRLRGGHARRRARDARRPGARGQRSRGRRGLDAARRRRQGHLGADGAGAARGHAATARSSRQVGAHAAPGLHSLARWSKTSTGWAATPCAARTPRGCCCGPWRRAAMRACSRTRAQLCRDLGAVARGRRGLRCAARRATRRVCRPTCGISPGAHRRCATGCRRAIGAASSGCSGRCRRRWPRAAAAAKSTSDVLLSLAALTGFSEEDMMHDEGWRVMRLGRRIERMHFVAEHPGAPARESARHAARDRRMAARSVRQHAYLPRALRSARRGCRRC